MRWLPLDISRGVNMHDDVRALQPGEYRYGKNLVPVPRGVLSKRGGLERPWWAEADRVGLGMIASPIPQGVNGKSDVLIVADPSGGKAQTVVVGVGLRNDDVPPAVQSEIALPFFSKRPWLFPWRNKAYLLPGHDAAWVAVSGPMAYRLDETSQLTQTSLVFAGTGNDNIHPKVASPFRVRMVYGNVRSGFKNTVIFTDDYTDNVVGSDVLAVNGRAVSLVSGDDGDEIWALTEIMLSAAGTPAQAALLVLRRLGEPFILTGDLDQSTGGTSTLAVQRLHIRTGCASPWTVANTPYGKVWAGNDDVWFYREGALPYPVGTKLKPIFSYVPPTEYIRMTGIYHDGFYRLQAFGEGQDINQPPTQQWWLDLRNGPPESWRDAKWYGPVEYLGTAVESVGCTPGLIGMVEVDTASSKELVYMANTQFAAGSPLGRAYAIGVVGDGPRDLVALDPASPLIVGIADKDFVGAEVLAELRTPEVVLEPGNLQQNDGVLFTVRADDDVAITATARLDNGQSASATKYVNPFPFRLGSDQLGTDPLAAKATSLALYPNTAQAAESHQFVISDEAGYVISAGVNDTLVLGVNEVTPVPVNPPQATLTVPAGVYTLATLIAAIEAAPILDGNGVQTYANLAAANVDVKILATGIVRFDDTPNQSFVNLTISLSDNNLVTGAFATAAQLKVSRRLAAILGLDTSATNLGFYGDMGGGLNVLDGIAAPFPNGVARWEMYGLKINMEVIPQVGS